MTPEMLKELAFTQEEIDELNRSREIPITFDEDCPETTPEGAVRFYRVNPSNKTVKEEKTMHTMDPDDLESEVQRMCNLSSVIENKARDEGIEFGELKTTVKYYRKGKLTIEEAAKDLNITVEEFTEKVNQFPLEVEVCANEECSHMARIKELADAADMIVSGYAFTRLPDGYRVINLNRLECVAFFSKDGNVIETSMCDIETTIALKFFEKNREFIDD